MKDYFDGWLVPLSMKPANYTFHQGSWVGGGGGTPILEGGRELRAIDTLLIFSYPVASLFCTQLDLIDPFFPERNNQIVYITFSSRDN